MKNIKNFFYILLFGKWSCGYEYWNGKPKLEFVKEYYDGWHYVLHIGSLWIEIDY